MATLFSVGDTFLLFETINKCNDILKMKDDSPTFLPCKLAAIVVVGTMYQVIPTFRDGIGIFGNIDKELILDGGIV